MEKLTCRRILLMVKKIWYNFKCKRFVKKILTNLKQRM
ncbi:putative hypothetical protein [Clostridium botulinum BKT015925]|nr:putative hypothetical protein [Clostridium botulinum BKT015925]